MSYCIATVIGFVLGATCVIGTMLFIERDRTGRNPSAGEADSAPCTSREAFEKERLNKQWENFLNYDGSDKDQMSIGDE